MFRRHPLLSVLTLAYLGLVGWVTLGPQPVNAQNGQWLWALLRFFGRHDATSWLTYSRVEFLANVAMFVPVGIFLLLLFGRGRWFLSFFAAVALTVGIETAQHFIPGRVPDVRDLISNSSGALIGVIFALIVTTPKALRLRREARIRSRRHQLSTR